MSGISSKAVGQLENKSRFNDGNELQNNEFSDGSGLDAYDAGFRNCDPQVGRFWQTDPLSIALEEISPYTFSNNNPIFSNDPLGLVSDSSHPQLLNEVIVTAKRRSHKKEERVSPANTINPTPSNTTPPGTEPGRIVPKVQPQRTNTPTEEAPFAEVPVLGLRIFGTLALVLWPTPLGKEPVPEFRPWNGHGNDNNNSNPHIVYEFSFAAKDGKTPILKYGISDEFTNGLDRPERQLAGFVIKYGKTVTYKILARTLNRVDAKAIEFNMVRQHIDVWNDMPREQRLPKP